MGRVLCAFSKLITKCRTPNLARVTTAVRATQQNRNNHYWTPSVRHGGSAPKWLRRLKSRCLSELVRPPEGPVAEAGPRK